MSPLSPNSLASGETTEAYLFEARRLAASSKGVAVLDELRRLAPADWNDRLLEQSGVRVASDLVGCSVLPETRLLAPTCVALCDATGSKCMAMTDPWDESLLRQAVLAIGGGVFEPVAATSKELQDWHASLGPSRREGHPEASTSTLNSQSATVRSGSAIVEFVDRALTQAWRIGASDVHFECDRHGLTVKHRLDGVMTRFERLDSFQAAEEVISRLKVLSHLDITERRLPQDGRFRFAFDGLAIDLRVSIMPSVFGEDAVLRLLDKSTLRNQSADVTLDALGFDGAASERLRHLATLPHGMLLVTGPTGSGKTTSVYASLSEINTGLEKIITIEDPVEYELPGVLQIPVNEKKGLTFARGLRSILRHDPDRILVGEIRDAETAEIAVQSALTGHLVFTTVHANSLFDVIGRFRHFGLDMFGFVSSLNGVVVQRLMRRLCKSCCAPGRLTDGEAKWWARHESALGPQPERLQRAQGCHTCHDTGYRGRFVIAEVHILGDHLRDRILAGAEVTELKRLAFERDEVGLGVVTPLLHQAMRQVEAGETTLEEVFRVVGQG